MHYLPADTDHFKNPNTNKIAKMIIPNVFV